MPSGLSKGMKPTPTAGQEKPKKSAATSVRMRPDRDEILKSLEQVIDPELKRPVTELEMVRDVLVEDDGHVQVTIALTVAGCPLRHSFQEQVDRHVGAVAGVTGVELRFDVMSPEEKAALSSRLRGGRPERQISLDPGTARDRDRVGQRRGRKIDLDGKPRRCVGRAGRACRRPRRRRVQAIRSRTCWACTSGPWSSTG